MPCNTSRQGPKALTAPLYGRYLSPVYTPPLAVNSEPSSLSEQQLSLNTRNLAASAACTESYRKCGESQTNSPGRLLLLKTARPRPLNRLAPSRPNRLAPPRPPSSAGRRKKSRSRTGGTSCNRTAGTTFFFDCGTTKNKERTLFFFNFCFSMRLSLIASGGTLDGNLVQGWLLYLRPIW